MSRYRTQDTRREARCGENGRDTFTAAKRIAAGILCGSLLLSVPAEPVYAAAAGTTEITNTDLGAANHKTSPVTVNAAVDASFTVSLPSGITLDETDGSFSYAGAVGVKGEIGAAAAAMSARTKT